MWTKIIDLNALEGKERLFVKGDFGALLFLKKNGNWKAYDGLCPHAKAVLSYAEIEDNCIECPFHGWKFNLDDGRCEFPEGAPALQIFQIKFEKKEVYVDFNSKS